MRDPSLGPGQGSRCVDRDYASSNRVSLDWQLGKRKKRKCHHKRAQFNIVLVLLNIILKHNFKKLLISLHFFFFFQCQEYQNYCKVVKGVRKLFEIFSALWQRHENFLKDHVGVPKFFSTCFRVSKTFLTPQRFFPPQYRLLKMTTSLFIRQVVCRASTGLQLAYHN